MKLKKKAAPRESAAKAKTAKRCNASYPAGPAAASPAPAVAELQLVAIRHCNPRELTPSPENDKLYQPPDATDQDFKALVESVRADGIREPLVVTADRFIVSGHRRRAAAILAGLNSVPYLALPFRRRDDEDAFIRALREHNRQRVKTRDELAREAVIDVDADIAHSELIAYRAEKSRITQRPMALGDRRNRAAISRAKKPFLDAIAQVLHDRRDYWPLSVRQIHYALLNNPPLKHASKPNSVYQNDGPSYLALVNLVARARLTGDIAWGAVHDPTRPITIWNVHRHVHAFIASELQGLFRNYWRDLMQSQPNHVELVGEKNTVESILRPVAARFTVPLTIGRGFCSLPPRHDMAQRFKRSGKDNLIVLLVSDFDPDGECIAETFARSMRDDFSITNIHPIKVALTAQQVRTFNLPAGGKAKPTSSRYQAFVNSHGDAVYELEALEPSRLAAIVTEAIESVIDVKAFNAELDAEHEDARFLAALRQRATLAVRDVVGDAPSNEGDNGKDE